MGEISLTGQVRPVPQLEHRLNEAARLGFTRAVVPLTRHRTRKPASTSGMQIVGVSSLRDALNALHISGARRRANHAFASYDNDLGEAMD
jgi:DNA repair protein RadA/Sms